MKLEYGWLAAQTKAIARTSDVPKAWRFPTAVLGKNPPGKSIPVTGRAGYPDG
jgi:hypothetical protein